MGSTSSDYQIRESPRFTRHVFELIETAPIADAIQGVKWALIQDPYLWPVASEAAGRTVRIAKTKSYVREGIRVPPLHVYYTIVEDDKIIVLQWLIVVEEYF
jgi:hypothetical protein